MLKILSCVSESATLRTPNLERRVQYIYTFTYTCVCMHTHILSNFGYTGWFWKGIILQKEKNIFLLRPITKNFESRGWYKTWLYFSFQKACLPRERPPWMSTKSFMSHETLPLFPIISLTQFFFSSPSSL